jgi:hypothetical protein
MKSIYLVALAFCAACSASSTALATPDATNGDQNVVQDSVQVNGPLRLAVSDFSTQGGIQWTLPSILPGPGSLLIENTRYGSLCRFAVTGNAEVHSSSIALHVKFGERLTICTADIRALRYTAMITAPAGTYNVSVIHEFGAQADTLVRRTVVVR